MIELLKNFEGFIGPALLIVIGGIFKVWQLQIQDRRNAREAAAKQAIKDAEERTERERRDERLRKEAAEAVDRAQQAAEARAKEEREKLERELEREREDRRRENDRQQREMDTQIHHLRGKLQAYVNVESLHEKQIKVLEDQRQLLEEKLERCEALNESLKRRLRKHEPVSDE